MKKDLHMHSHYSDGSDSIEDLILLSLEAGLGEISITDHDTLSHIPELLSFRGKYPIRLRKGIEISCVDSRGKKIHILGYDFKFPAEHIEVLVQNTNSKRHRRSLEQLATLLESGYDMDLSTLIQRFEKSRVLYKQHLMKELIRSGYEKKLYGSLYQKLFKNHGVVSGDIVYPKAKDAIAAIHRDGGVAYLAHPGETQSFEIIEELIEIGLDGIEAYHPSHDEDMVQRVLDYKLPVSGGSDYHGLYEDQVKPPGSFAITVQDSVYDQVVSYVIDLSESFRWSQQEQVEVSLKEGEELVTNWDRTIQSNLEEFIQSVSSDPLLGEESRDLTYCDTCWILDPIDGTRNFILDQAHFSISLAHQTDGKLDFGLITDIMSGDYWVAYEDGIVYKNGRKMAYKFQNTGVLEANFKAKDFSQVIAQVEKVKATRYIGAISLSMIAFIEGRRDWVYSRKAYIWDYAAAKYFIECLGLHLRIYGQGIGPYTIAGWSNESENIFLE